MAARSAPDPRRVRTLADLTRELDRLRRGAAGAGQVRLSVRELARKTGRAPSTLDPYLRGQRLCPEDTFEEMLRALGIPHERLGPWLDAWERVADAWSGPDPPAPALPTPLTSGLPRTDSYFTGRTRELADLVAAVTATGEAGLCVVHGLAGVGKTALAVRAAGALAEHFPEGIIFIDLHGYTGSRAPLPPAEALDRLLRRLGVDGERIPVDLDERSGLWRSLLADRRLLLVLDNAHDAAQVRPLLPAATGCTVIITSRRRLAALDDAHVVRLDVLDSSAAATLFTEVAGPDRVLNEPMAQASVVRIVTWCGRLPLAIRIAAACYRANPMQRLADLDAQLADPPAGLAALDDGERNVALCFQASLADLPSATRHAFALLAISPGADFDLFAAAAALGQGWPAAVGHVDRLAGRSLLIQDAPHRYRFHDLIAAFARTYEVSCLPPAERAGALQRVVDYYLRAADRADRLVTPHRFRVRLDLLDAAPALPELADYPAALDWLMAEQANLADVCTAAGAAELDAPCWQLAHTLRGHYFLTKQWQPWIAIHTAALAAARRCGDLRAEAMTANNLGLAHLERGDHRLAASHYRDALRLFVKAGDRHGEHTARANLAWLQFAQRRYGEFLQQTEPVLAFYIEEGARRNAAITQRGTGLARAALGRTGQAVEDLGQALAVFTELGLRLDIAMTLNGLGETNELASEPTRAAEAFTRAVAASEQSGSRFERARAYHGLGRVAAACGDHDRARTHWQQALADYQHLGAPQAAEVQSLLAGGQSSPAPPPRGGNGTGPGAGSGSCL